MRKRLFIVVAATGALALPSAAALAAQPTDTESNSQGSLVGQLNSGTTGRSIPAQTGYTMGDIMQRVHEAEDQGSLSDHGGGNCKACELPPR
jgi:hypothetical protein